VKLGPPWEAVICAETRELSSILYKNKVYYHVHKSLPLLPILSQINSLHSISVRSILILSTHLCLSFLVVSFFVVLSPLIYMHSRYIFWISNPLRLGHSSYTWWRAQDMELLLRVFYVLLWIHPLWVQIFSSAPCSLTHLVCNPSLIPETKFRMHAEPQAKLQLLYSNFMFLNSRHEDRMVPSIIQIQSTLNFFLNKKLIRCCHL
jgi:hypothetical protein